VAYGPGSWLSTCRSRVEPGRFAKALPQHRALITFSENVYRPLLEATGLDRTGVEAGLASAVAARVAPPVGVYLASFGAPAATMLMESLLASGATSVVMVGEAGAIAASCRIGDVVVPTWGLREEGTSYHYLPADVTCRPAPDLLDWLRRALAPGAKWLEGGVWTTDAPFRETADKVRRYSAQGVLAVEMECTALMSVAMYRAVPFAAVLVITDELHGDGWVEEFGGERAEGARRRVCRLLAAGMK